MNNNDNKAKALKNNPEIKEKVIAEATRLLESGEAATPEEAMVIAIKNALGIDVSLEKMRVLSEEAQKMDLNDLDNVAGGKIGHIEYRLTDKEKREATKHYTGLIPTLMKVWSDEFVDGANFLIDGVNEMFGLE